MARRTHFRVSDVKRDRCRDPGSAEVISCATRELKLVNNRYVFQRNCQSVFRYLYDRWIAYQRVSLLWMDDIFLASTNNGENRQVTREGVLMSGLAWAPDASGIV